MFLYKFVIYKLWIYKFNLAKRLEKNIASLKKKNSVQKTATNLTRHNALALQIQKRQLEQNHVALLLGSKGLNKFVSSSRDMITALEVARESTQPAIDNLNKIRNVSAASFAAIGAGAGFSISKFAAFETAPRFCAA